MKLPNVPYTPKVVRNALPRFGGLNLTEGFSEGELLSCENLSARKYPCLAPQPAPVPQTPEGEGITDAFYVGGKLLTVAGGKVYIDGKYVCLCDVGKVQAVSINTKIFITPGNYLYDCKTEKCEKTDEGKNYSGCSYTEDDGTITLSIPYLGTKLREQYFGGGATFNIFTYGATENDRTALLNCYVNNEWNRTALEQLAHRKKTQLNSNEMLTPGLCFIPTDTGDLDYFIDNSGAVELNTNGKIGILLSRTGSQGIWKIKYRLINDADAVPQNFIEGDLFALSETPGGVWDTDVHVLTVEYDGTTMKTDITVSGEELPVAVAYCTLPESVSAGEWRVWMGMTDTTSEWKKRQYKCVVPQLDAGTTLWSTESLETNEDRTFYYRINGTVKSFRAKWLSSSRDPNPDLMFSRFVNEEEPFGMSGQRKMPELDYICERDNRLCGVSNEDRTVYVSALGLPQVFYDVGGDEGSYSVAVATPGDFTGICSYGGALCCFKENGVFKLMGAVPSEYYSASYEFAGPARGAFRTLTQINGYLYYLSRDGVYVYSGSYPRKISEKLGELALSGASAAFDGGGYVLAGKNASGADVVLRYDLEAGIWLSPFTGGADALFKTESGFYAVRDGRIYDARDGAAFGEFEASFTPFFETAVTRRGYLRIVIRAEIARGAYLEAFISCDGAPFRSCGIIRAARDGLYSLPLKPGRCDKFEIKLRGEGDVTVRELVREYVQTEG